MTDQQALLRAVLLSPTDDLPRLVFADWLEEHGDADRAALIRWQVATGAEFVRLNGKWQRSGVRADAVPPGCWRALNAILQEPLVAPLIVSRGFVRYSAMSTGLFTHLAKRYFGSHPLTAVALTDREPDPCRDGEFFRWYDGSRRRDDGTTDDAPVCMSASELPGSLWRTFHDNPGRWRSLVCRELSWSFPTEADALESLSSACVAYGRSLAGLPPLPG